MTKFAGTKLRLAIASAAVPSVLLMFAAAALSGVRGFAQANVVENEPITVYVDASAGSDSNPGSQALPFRTVSAGALAAERNNVKGLGTKVLINPGVYREHLMMTQLYGTTSAPITLQATVPGTAAIAGSDVFTNFYQGTSNSGIYSHAWPYATGTCAIPSGWPANMQPILLRREMVIVNGMPLTQVMALSQMMPGTFFVDDNAQVLQIWPVAGTSMGTALVEVAARPSTVDIQSRSNLVLRGLVFEHAASCVNTDGANTWNGSNILIDGIQANWNSWGGFETHSTTNVTVQNSIASHNGAIGFNGYRGKQILFQNNESDYNNWRGAQAAFYDFGMGGTKFWEMHGTTVLQHRSFNNQAQGLWFDTDNANIQVTGAVLSGNYVDNLQVELNYGPVNVQNSTLCYGAVGTYLVNSSNVSFVGNTFYDNGGSTAHTQPEIYLGGKPGGRNYVDWETGVYYNIIANNITLTNNTVIDASPNEHVFGTFLSGSDWSTFVNSFSSTGNHWYDSFTTTAFTTSTGKIAFSKWQSLTNQDWSSTWAPVTPAAQTCTAPPTSFPDFAMYADAAAYSTTNSAATVSLLLKQFAAGNTTSPLAYRRSGPNATIDAGGSAPLNLSVAGLPSGFAASFGTGTLSNRGMAMNLVVTAPQGASAQSFPITIFAQSGPQVHTITVTVNVS